MALRKPRPRGPPAITRGGIGGANACVNRMGTFPMVTRRWWVEEFEALKAQQAAEVEAETQAAFALAAERSARAQSSTSAS